jgi:sulfite exporter TauE/SafE
MGCIKQLYGPEVRFQRPLAIVLQLIQRVINKGGAVKGKQSSNNIRSEFLMVVFWGVRPCGLVGRYRTNVSKEQPRRPTSTK